MASLTSLQKLPAEILDDVLDLLPKKALANLRLASRYYQQRAKPYLYRYLRLHGSSRDAARAWKIIQQQSLAPLVRELTLITGWNDPVMKEHDRKRFLHDLCRLIRLRSLSIEFYHIRTVHNSNFFATLFSAPMVWHFISCGLDRLSITKLQSRDEPFVTTSPGFLQLIRNIRTLELGIWTIEHWNSSRWREISKEAVSFYLKLPQTWLAPASPNLRMLHLSADKPWGWYPKVDFRGIYFPHLRDLMLSRFTFSHDWHLQWFSDHAASLLHLALVNCSILDHAASTGQHFDSEGYPLGVEPREAGTKVQGSHSHKKRWSHYFNALENTLPRLMSFSLLSPDHVLKGTHLQAVLEEEIVPIRDANFYLRFRSYGKTYYPLFGDEFGTGDEGNIYVMLQRERQGQQEEDEQALRELLNKIQQRNRVRA